MTGADSTNSKPQPRRCACCGEPAEAESDLCEVCATEIDTAQRIEAPDENLEADHPPPIPKLIDLEAAPGVLSEANGLTRVDWDRVQDHLRKHFVESDVNAGWMEAERQWLHLLKADLGGSYRMRESRKFMLLSDYPSSRKRAALEFCEVVWSFLAARLPDIVWTEGDWKTPVLIFSDLDDYYAYVLHFYPDGKSAASAGMCISRGAVHVVGAATEGRIAQSVLAHELSHAAVTHLPLPVWLNEGIAQAVERDAGGAHTPLVDGDLSTRHHAYWNAERIQEFWAGASFYESGEPIAMSYNLAAILTQLAAVSAEQFSAFVQTAHYSDAGQTAALDHLGRSLEEIAVEFLGPGDWRPNRKSIAEIIRQQREQYGSKEQPSEGENRPTSSSETDSADRAD